MTKAVGLTTTCLPVLGHSNDKTITADMGFLPGGNIADISAIAVNPDSFKPCLANGPPDSNGNPTPTAHCDLQSTDPGAKSTDAPAVQGFAAQLGFRLPNLVISPFTRKHYVSHVPTDHTAVIKFVETRFIGPFSLSGMRRNRTCWISSTSAIYRGRFRRRHPAFRFLPRWNRRAHPQACRHLFDERV